MRNPSLITALLMMAAPSTDDLPGRSGLTAPLASSSAPLGPAVGNDSILNGIFKELTVFTAEATGHAVRIRWQVAVEHAASAYAVERSADALSWEGVAHIAAMGIDSAPLVYEHLDHPGTPGTWYYRLRGVDVLGRAGTGPVVAVRYQPPRPEMVLWPNPAGSELNVVHDGAQGPVRYRVHHRTGSVIAEGWLAPEDRRLDVRLLPAGMHTLVLSDSRGMPLGSALWMKE